jgi:hypothetical protein
MKRRISILLLLIVSLALASCAPARVPASQAMTEAMDAIKAADYEKVKEYLGTDSPLGDDNSPAEDYDGLTKDQLAAFFENLSYKILSSSEDKQTATIEIEITNKDMQAVFDKYLSAAVEMFLSEDSEELTEEEQAAKVADILITLIEEQEDYVTSTVTVDMSYTGGKWTIDSNPDFVNAIMGGLDMTIPDQG